MWLVIEEVVFESYYSALDKEPYGLYHTEEAANRAVIDNDLDDHLVIYVEVKG